MFSILFIIIFFWIFTIALSIICILFLRDALKFWRIMYFEANEGWSQCIDELKQIATDIENSQTKDLDIFNDLS